MTWFLGFLLFKLLSRYSLCTTMWFLVLLGTLSYNFWSIVDHPSLSCPILSPYPFCYHAKPAIGRVVLPSQPLLALVIHPSAKHNVSCWDLLSLEHTWPNLSQHISLFPLFSRDSILQVYPSFSRTIKYPSSEKKNSQVNWPVWQVWQEDNQVYSTIRQVRHKDDQVYWSITQVTQK